MLDLDAGEVSRSRAYVNMQKNVKLTKMHTSNTGLYSAERATRYSLSDTPCISPLKEQVRLPGNVDRSLCGSHGEPWLNVVVVMNPLWLHAFDWQSRVGPVQLACYRLPFWPHPYDWDIVLGRPD